MRALFDRFTPACSPIFATIPRPSASSFASRFVDDLKAMAALPGTRRSWLRRGRNKIESCRLALKVRKKSQ